MSALYGAQQAIAAALVADSTLTALLAVSVLDGVSPAIFNDVPNNQTFPYIDIGKDSTERPWNTIGGPTVGLGFDDKVVVHIFSRYQGMTEMSSILKEVVRILNFATLTISGYPTVMCELDNARLLVEMINKIETRHCPAVFRLRISQ
jgi:hypothetical protein